MIDFHNHIIPNLDDGSKSVDMSLDMLKEAQAQGITDIVNTVHYQHPTVETEDISYILLNNRCFMTVLSNYFGSKNYNSLCIKMNEARYILGIYLVVAVFFFNYPKYSIYVTLQKMFDF